MSHPLVRSLFPVLLLFAGCPRERGAALPFGASDATCASCHAQADDFSASAHAHAAESPVLTALLPRVEQAWGAAARERCVGCHAPEHVPEEDREGPIAGISCVSCHAAVGNRGSFDGRLVVDLGEPLDGPFADPEETPAHASTRRGFVSDAQSCLTCHDLRGPELFVEPTGMEHAEAVSLLDAPSCASCHMPEMEEGPIADGASHDRPRRSHRFVGPTPPDEREGPAWERYKTDLRGLFAGRVTLEVEGDRARLRNVAMGHALPTGVTFLRSLRVEVSIAGDVERTAVILELGDRATRAGAPVVLPTDGDAVERRRVDPGETREVRVELADGERIVAARLIFSAYRADVLDALGLDPALGPEVVVLTAEPGP